MAAKKPTIARTYAPVHFEDLDPHRFEDLVRELIYDFRDWRSIEATGRSGGDEGFDIRAREKSSLTVEGAEEDDSTVSHPMDGNVWMIQGKREKELGPKRVKEILADVKLANPPYGYILAASAVFSKASYDLFRDELRKKGVMEFYLWGKSELEDMLYLPKNDRILFTFFGVSLTSRRRSRATEVRSLVVIKNRLYKALGAPDQEFDKTILLRDIADTKYPYKKEYPDFDTNPRWSEYTAFAHHPVGFWVHRRKYYAYVDQDSKKWAYTKHSDILFKSSDTDDDRAKRNKLNEEVKAVWEFLPRSQQGYLSIDELIRYEDVVVVDPEGDGWHKFPHIYAEYSLERGPFHGQYIIIEIGNVRIDPADDSWKRIEFFPNAFQTKKPRWKLNKRHLQMDPATLKAFQDYSSDADTLYAIDGAYDFLKVRDILQIAGLSDGDERFVQVTWKGKLTFGGYIKNHADEWRARMRLKSLFGRDLESEEEITVIEIQRVYKNQWQ